MGQFHYLHIQKLVDEPYLSHHPSDLPVAHSQHGVVQTVNIVVTVLLEVDSAGVEAEALVSCVNSHRDRAVTSDGDLKREEFVDIEEALVIP